MNGKLRIRIGDLEIDCEGTEDFLKKELPALLRTAMELHNTVGLPPGAHGDAGGSRGPARKSLPSLTTSTIAAKLKSDSGPTLLLAAAGHLSLVKNKDTFTRQELLTEMKGAPAYYKKSYSSNLSRYLARAVTEGKLQETAKNTYALSADTRSELETQIADS